VSPGLNPCGTPIPAEWLTWAPSDGPGRGCIPVSELVGYEGLRGPLDLEAGGEVLETICCVQ
jgi:hypothetical protein